MQQKAWMIIPISQSLFILI